VRSSLRLPVLATSAALLAFAKPAAGQVVAGAVVEAESGAPISGAFVLLEDEGGEVRARALSGPGGTFRVEVPGPGAWRLRLERIGYAVATSPPLRLEAGEVLEYRFEVEVRPVRLREIPVEERARCDVLPAEGVALQETWDEARKALSATAWTGQQPYFRFDVVLHTRRLDARGRPLDGPVLEEARFFGRHPFRSIPARDLVLGGFVQEPPGLVAYYAPDADVLLSATFVRRHCFRLERRDGLLGLRFRTLPTSRLADIEGVMWLDPASAELRSLDFHYVNLEGPADGERLGGRVEFDRLPTGAWIVRRWWIRTPVIEWVGSGRPRDPGRLKVVAIDEGGGQVTAVWLTARIAGLIPVDTLDVTAPPDSLLVRYDLEEPGPVEPR
jgi:hypothetical protein